MQSGIIARQSAVPGDAAKAFGEQCREIDGSAGLQVRGLRPALSRVSRIQHKSPLTMAE